MHRARQFEEKYMREHEQHTRERATQSTEVPVFGGGEAHERQS